MPSSDREDTTDGRIGRRRMLKGTAVAGLLGVAGAGTASAQEWHEIAFTSVSDTVFEYWLEVSGEVKRGGTYGSDAGDEVGANTVHGKCAEGRSDSFLFTGADASLRVNGPGKVLVDGTIVMDTRTEAATDLPKEAIVSSPDTDGLLEYAFEVTGDLVELEPDEDGPPATEEITHVGDRTRVEGAVSYGDDRFAFSGDLVRTDVPPGVEIAIRER